MISLVLVQALNLNKGFCEFIIILKFTTIEKKKTFRALLSTSTEVLDPSLCAGQEFNMNPMHINHNYFVFLCFDKSPPTCAASDHTLLSSPCSAGSDLCSTQEFWAVLSCYAFSLQHVHRSGLP